MDQAQFDSDSSDPDAIASTTLSSEFEALLERVAQSPARSRPPMVGDTIADRYRLESILGRGGMGIVFAARDERLARSVALKWTSAPDGDGSEASEVVRRFRREGRVAANIGHPNVVHIYDVGHDGSSAYLVMEHLVGESLRSRIVRGPVDWDTAMTLLLPALDGVAALHRNGIVHRDLKPENLFLCEAIDAIPSTTKVLDFGVCRDTRSAANTLTRTGSVVGTPAYMPLEQLRGERSIGPASDVHALGIVLYELLCGSRPFDARTAADQAVLIATTEPRPIRERVPGLVRERSDVVMRAIARDPSDRFDSIDAFAAALRSATSPRRTWRAPKVIATAISVVSVIGVASVLGAVALSSRPQRPIEEAARVAPAVVHDRAIADHEIVANTADEAPIPTRPPTNSASSGRPSRPARERRAPIVPSEPEQATRLATEVPDEPPPVAPIVPPPLRREEF